jgi:glycosyltransferase involved in cell wall biosynthesis
VVDRLIDDADILHTYALRGPRYDAAWSASGRRWVATCHVDPHARGVDGRDAPASWIFVSRTIAAVCGRMRYVTNGVDPSEYLYSDVKSDFVLFMAAVDRPVAKGLDIALRVAAAARVRLIVTGTAQTAEGIDAVVRMCEASDGAEYIGDVQGAAKAELLAAARAVLLPSRLNEAGPLLIAEALVSGTPVICSANGACPEMVSGDTGFVCRTDAEYVRAIERAHEISPAACRAKALRDFHYLRMAREYVREYEAECSASMGTHARPYDDTGTTRIG